ncbi:putative F-box/LRR-repeat protein 23 [Salvia hispanica]|uniref:putative F-box/LRR-repeat protein 23 n=1 Tax=Salvia hispanica TaxID=49212 RepID=UPI002009B793|nr:putative F-box/LRR-repeat protein 23 [Salvia hispanica]
MKPRKRNPKKSKKLKRGSSSSAPWPPWIELPEHLTADILQRLYTEEIIESAQCVCTTWWRVCQNPATWRSIDLDYRRPAARDESVCEGSCTHDDVCHCGEDKFAFLVRRAVDLSQGQLLNLKLGVWDLYESLNYVAHRSSQLQSLTFLQCGVDYDTSGLILAIKKLPQLEELHLMMNPKLVSDDFETIGIACPMLKSFSYHNCFDEDADFAGDVVAIRKTMPNLHHLRLCEHPMGYKGLEAILDDCPHLKSLDLRLCSGLEKVYDSDHRLSERGDLWLHTDSISFMDWITKRKDNYDSDFEYGDCYHCCADIEGDYY